MSGPAATRRAARLLPVALGVLGAALVVWGPIPQPEAYHRFADARPWLGIPHAADVLSNVPFLLVAFAGIGLLRRERTATTRMPGWARLAFGLCVLGVGGTAVGSVVYHLAPTSRTLVWDRLPMALAFGALAGLVAGAWFGPRVGRALTLPAALAGVASVLLWRATLAEGRADDDLRAYVFVQYGGLLVVAVCAFFLPGPREGLGALRLALGFYGVAKVLEALDEAVLDATGGLVAGHALKHLAAAAGTAYVVRWVRLAASRGAFGGPVLGGTP